MFHFCFVDKNTIRNFANPFFPTSYNVLNKNHRMLLTPLSNIHAKTKVDVYEKYEILKRIKEKSTLKNSLKKFRELVKTKTVNKGYNFYEGWPPINRIKITEDEKVGNFGRSMFIFNRVTGSTGKLEPNLCICCKGKNIILLNKKEFEALINNMDFLKRELQEFGKKI